MHTLAYSCIDMQDKDHVNLFQGSWVRCREVAIVGTHVHCILATDRTYDLISAYERDPHLQFIGCVTNEQLLAFVRSWGPLTLSWDDSRRGACSAPLGLYRAFQEWLKAVVGLLSALKSMDRERESLQAFIQAEVAWQQSLKQSAETDLLIVGLKLQHNIEGDLLAWLGNAPVPDVRSAIAFVVQTVPLGATSSLQCTRRSGKSSVRARWNISSLQEALSWMVWYDEFTENPLICCQACRRIFRPETAHARKYCCYECAHRVAAREWQRKQGKLKKGEKYVTRKTR